ncbi:hypothetical protein FNF29_04416 [Cafeteria roenbergensis]|uniref:BK channel n=5 Tax=Cafeteria roenbergensis TaxID=33653 RepID=A0A5A8CFE5_CAFRO|nr:hypothetical protein FNF29_04416 [Cafeteria roenbergensis]|eukprot:KAA0151732.1 hypothetical protein FNF29_04416 [Cafeteria roenbergensis]
MLREQVQKTVASDSGRVASQQCTTRARQWCQAMLRDPGVAFGLDLLQGVLAVASCIIYVIEVNLEATQPELPVWLPGVEVFFATCFLLDYLLRLFAAQDRAEFAMRSSSIIDVITVLPVLSPILNLPTSVAFVRVLRALRISRVLRLFRSVDGSGGIGDRETFADVERSIRKQVVSLVLTIASFLFVAAGICHVVEQVQPGSFSRPNIDDSDCPFERTEDAVPSYLWPSHCRFSLLDAFYLAVVTASTIGFGDIAPTTDTARIVILVIIAVLFIIIPRETTKLTELLARSTPYAKPLTRSPDGHVVVCGDVSLPAAVRFLAEFYHEDHGAVARKKVAIMRSTEPSAEWVGLLHSPRYESVVQYVLGSPLVREDLDRVAAKEADAIFVLTSAESGRNAGVAFEADAMALLTVRSVRDVSPSVPVILQLLRQDSMDRNVWANADLVVCRQSLKMSVLAMSTLFPGVSTLLANLVSSFSDREAERFIAGAAADYRPGQPVDDETESFVEERGFGPSAPRWANWSPDEKMAGLVAARHEARIRAKAWRVEYAHSMGQEVYSVPISPLFVRRSFEEVAVAVHRSYGCVLFAVETQRQNHHPRWARATRGSMARRQQRRYDKTVKRSESAPKSTPSTAARRAEAAEAAGARAEGAMRAATPTTPRGKGAGSPAVVGGGQDGTGLGVRPRSSMRQATTPRRVSVHDAAQSLTGSSGGLRGSLAAATDTAGPLGGPMAVAGSSSATSQGSDSSAAERRDGDQGSASGGEETRGHGHGQGDDEEGERRAGRWASGGAEVEEDATGERASAGSDGRAGASVDAADMRSGSAKTRGPSAGMSLTTVGRASRLPRRSMSSRDVMSGRPALLPAKSDGSPPPSSRARAESVLGATGWRGRHASGRRPARPDSPRRAVTFARGLSHTAESEAGEEDGDLAAPGPASWASHAPASRSMWNLALRKSRAASAGKGVSGPGSSAGSSVSAAARARLGGASTAASSSSFTMKKARRRIKQRDSVVGDLQSGLRGRPTASFGRSRKRSTAAQFSSLVGTFNQSPTGGGAFSSFIGPVQRGSGLSGPASPSLDARSGARDSFGARPGRSPRSPNQASWELEPERTSEDDDAEHPTSGLGSARRRSSARGQVRVQRSASDPSTSSGEQSAEGDTTPKLGRKRTFWGGPVPEQLDPMPSASAIPVKRSGAHSRRRSSTAPRERPRRDAEAAAKAAGSWGPREETPRSQQDSGHAAGAAADDRDYSDIRSELVLLMAPQHYYLRAEDRVLVLAGDVTQALKLAKHGLVPQRTWEEEMDEEEAALAGEPVSHSRPEAPPEGGHGLPEDAEDDQGPGSDLSRAAHAARGALGNLTRLKHLSPRGRIWIRNQRASKSRKGKGPRFVPSMVAAALRKLCDVALAGLDPRVQALARRGEAPGVSPAEAAEAHRAIKLLIQKPRSGSGLQAPTGDAAADLLLVLEPEEAVFLAALPDCNLPPSPLNFHRLPAAVREAVLRSALPKGTSSSAPPLVVPRDLSTPKQVPVPGWLRQAESACQGTAPARLKGHIIIGGDLSGLPDLIRPLRRATSQVVVVLAPRASLRRESSSPEARVWRMVKRVYSGLVHVDGSPLRPKDLLRAGVQRAGCVLILSSEGAAERGSSGSVQADSAGVGADGVAAAMTRDLGALYTASAVLLFSQERERELAGVLRKQRDDGLSTDHARLGGIGDGAVPGMAAVTSSAAAAMDAYDVIDKLDRGRLERSRTEQEPHAGQRPAAHGAGPIGVTVEAPPELRSASAIQRMARDMPATPVDPSTGRPGSGFTAQSAAAAARRASLLGSAPSFAIGTSGAHASFFAGRPSELSVSAAVSTLRPDLPTQMEDGQLSPPGTDFAAHGTAARQRMSLGAPTSPAGPRGAAGSDDDAIHSASLMRAASLARHGVPASSAGNATLKTKRSMGAQAIMESMSAEGLQSQVQAFASLEADSVGVAHNTADGGSHASSSTTSRRSALVGATPRVMIELADDTSIRFLSSTLQHPVVAQRRRNVRAAMLRAKAAELQLPPDDGEGRAAADDVNAEIATALEEAGMGNPSRSTTARGAGLGQGEETESSRLRPLFASGRVFLGAMLDSLATGLLFNPLLLRIVTQLLYGASAPGATSSSEGTCDPRLAAGLPVIVRADASPQLSDDIVKAPAHDESGGGWASGAMSGARSPFTPGGLSEPGGREAASIGPDPPGHIGLAHLAPAISKQPPSGVWGSPSPSAMVSSPAPKGPSPRDNKAVPERASPSPSQVMQAGLPGLRVTPPDTPRSAASSGDNTTGPEGTSSGAGFPGLHPVTPTSRAAHSSLGADSPRTPGAPLTPSASASAAASSAAAAAAAIGLKVNKWRFKQHDFLRQLAVPESFHGRRFHSLFQFLVVEHRMVPLALFRSAEALGAPAPYVVTNPRPDLRVHRQDRVFVLCGVEHVNPAPRQFRSLAESDQLGDDVTAVGPETAPPPSSQTARVRSRQPPPPPPRVKRGVRAPPATPPGAFPEIDSQLEGLGIVRIDTSLGMLGSGDSSPSSSQPAASPGQVGVRSGTATGHARVEGAPSRSGSSDSSNLGSSPEVYRGGDSPDPATRSRVSPAGAMPAAAGRTTPGLPARSLAPEGLGSGRPPVGEQASPLNASRSSDGLPPLLPGSVHRQLPSVPPARRAALSTGQAGGATVQATPFVGLSAVASGNSDTASTALSAHSPSERSVGFEDALPRVVGGGGRAAPSSHQLSSPPGTSSGFSPLGHASMKAASSTRASIAGTEGASKDATAPRKALRKVKSGATSASVGAAALPFSAEAANRSRFAVRERGLTPVGLHGGAGPEGGAGAGGTSSDAGSSSEVHSGPSRGPPSTQAARGTTAHGSGGATSPGDRSITQRGRWEARAASSVVGSSVAGSVTSFAISSVSSGDRALPSPQGDASSQPRDGGPGRGRAGSDMAGSARTSGAASEAGAAAATGTSSPVRSQRVRVVSLPSIAPLAPGSSAAQPKRE